MVYRVREMTTESILSACNSQLIWTGITVCLWRIAKKARKKHSTFNTQTPINGLCNCCWRRAALVHTPHTRSSFSHHTIHLYFILIRWRFILFCCSNALLVALVYCYIRANNNTRTHTRIHESETMVALLPHYYLNRIELKSSRKYSTHFSRIQNRNCDFYVSASCAAATAAHLS